jgi:hypothetical protein
MLNYRTRARTPLAFFYFNKEKLPRGWRDEHATYVHSSFSHTQHNFKRFLIEIKAALCVKKIVAVKKVFLPRGKFLFDLIALYL